MKEIITSEFTIEIGDIRQSSFQTLISSTFKDAKKIIIVDENTHDNCLEYLITTFDDLKDAEVMLLPVGEENKVMEVCFQVWQAFSEYQISRKDLVINLGGGVVTDMGGFIASIFKRGVQFVNIPTTLLGMVDASIGGKNGIDLGPYKNQLGTFQHPKTIYVDPLFLGTLPEYELLNGYAEMLKHALISDKNKWQQLVQIQSLEDLIDANLIQEAIQVKVAIVEQDPTEKGVRKILNFGHTIGHGLEGYFLDKEPISHGHAVGLGMLAESYISQKKGLLPIVEWQEIASVLMAVFPKIDLEESDFEGIIELMGNDKKNHNHQVLGTCLTGIGNCSYDVVYSLNEIEEALFYLMAL